MSTMYRSPRRCRPQPSGLPRHSRTADNSAASGKRISAMVDASFGGCKSRNCRQFLVAAQTFGPDSSVTPRVRHRPFAAPAPSQFLGRGLPPWIPRRSPVDDRCRTGHSGKTVAYFRRSRAAGLGRVCQSVRPRPRHWPISPCRPALPAATVRRARSSSPTAVAAPALPTPSRRPAAPVRTTTARAVRRAPHAEPRAARRE